MSRNNDYIKPSRELVYDFLYNNENPIKYSFRKENKKLSDDYEGVINFKLYRIDPTDFDCDRCELNMSIWCILLENMDKVKEVIGYKGRTIRYIDLNDNIVEVETDTINSLGTELNRFIREVILRKYDCSWVYLYSNGVKIEQGKKVYDYYDLNRRKQSEKNRDLWFIDNYKEIFKEDTLSEQETRKISAFNKLADTMHTIGNFMIGPVGFNYSDPLAKSHFQDRFDLFIKEVISNEDYEKWKEWFMQYEEILFISSYFENKSINWDDKTRVINLRSGDVSNWEEIVNVIIEERSKIIVKMLKNIIKRKEE